MSDVCAASNHGKSISTKSSWRGQTPYGDVRSQVNSEGFETKFLLYGNTAQ